MLFVYILREPGDPAIRYVGATNNLKRRAHLRTQQLKYPRSASEKWLASLAMRGLAAEVEIVEVWPVRRAGLNAEKWFLWNCIVRGEPVLNEVRWDVCDLETAASVMGPS